MQINKVIIHKEDKQITTIAYAKNKLFTLLTDNLNDLATESIIIGKITRINQANYTAFIEYGENQTGFINLPKNKGYQVGSPILAQLTWLGDNNKQPKFRNSFELVGKYLVYHQTSQELSIKAKHLTNTTIHVLQQHLAKLTAKWIVRSALQDSNDIIAILSEAKQLYSKAQQIEATRQKLTMPSILSNGTPNYLRLIRELTLSNDCEIITNDLTINQQLLDLQDSWLIEAISYAKNITITKALDEYTAAINQATFKTHNNTIIEYGQVAGIHIFDINDNYNQLGHNATNYDALNSIYEQTILRNLQGIILLDIIKNTTKHQQQKIITKLQYLFSYDISRTQILGISNSGLVELIRNKY